MMNLLYVTVKALLNPHVDDELVRCIFELRTMAEQGYCPELVSCVSCGKNEIPENECFFSQTHHGILCRECACGIRDAFRISGAALYAMRYIVSSPMGRLYTFTVTPEVLEELKRIIFVYTERNTDRRFKSLEILNLMSK